jgi:hypothetical protein
MEGQNRGEKRTREDSDHRDERYNAEPPHYDAAADEEDVQVEVTTGEGKTVKMQLPPAATVLMVKQEVERAQGIAPRDACIFVHDDAREEKLEDEETLRSLRRAKGALVSMSLLVEKADAQQVVPALSAKANMTLGDGEAGNGDAQLYDSMGVAFVPAYPDWIVTTEYGGHRVKVTNIRTGSLVCKLGKEQLVEEVEDEDGRYSGKGEGEFDCPWGVAVTCDSALILVADCFNYRVQVLRLVVGEDASSAHLEFVRFLSAGHARVGRTSQLQLERSVPSGVALLQGTGQGQPETVLVLEESRHRVLQCAIDGSFIRVFAGTGEQGGGDGELCNPQGITVMASSGEVAIVEGRNNRVQIFDGEGNYKRQFGSEGRELDGQFDFPAGITSDAHGNLLVTDSTKRLQVFSPEGKHLCTRTDLELNPENLKGVAWSATGELAIANGSDFNLLLWGLQWR